MKTEERLKDNATIGEVTIGEVLVGAAIITLVGSAFMIFIAVVILNIFN